MIKTLSLAAIVAAAVTTQALADDQLVPCTHAEMQKVGMMIHAAKDAAMMKMAMHDMEMAQTMANSGKFHDCRMDLTKAMKDVMPKQ